MSAIYFGGAGRFLGVAFSKGEQKKKKRLPSEGRTLFCERITEPKERSSPTTYGGGGIDK